MRRYVSDLSSNGLQRLSKELEKYEKNLDVSVDYGLQTLAKLGTDIALQEGSRFSDNLIKGNVTWYKVEKEHYVITTLNPLLTLLEYGTGVIGQNNPSPTAIKNGYQYKIGSKIKTYTITYASGITVEKEGWFYFDKKKGKVRFTQGLPPRPFFETTAKFLHEVAPRYVGSSIEGGSTK